MSIEPQQTHRALLSVSVGEPPSEPIPQCVCSSWEVLDTRDVAAAHKVLKSRRFTVGLLLMGRLTEADFAALARLVEDHPATQWVGVLPAGLATEAACRHLIVRHLFDFL